MNKKFGYLEGMRFLSKYLIKYRKVFLLFFLGGTIETVITVLTPIIFSVMIDQIVYYRDIAVFLRISMVFIIMTIFTCLLYFIIYTFHHYLMSMYTFDIKMDIFRKFLDSKAKNLVNAKSGEVINHLIYDSAECLHFVIRNVIHMINGLAKGIFYLVYIYAIDFWAGIIVTFFLPIAAVIIFRQKEKLRETAGQCFNEMLENGVANYFGEQRFSENNIKMGRYILKGKIEKAAMINREREVLEHLKKHPKDYVGALKKLPKKLLTLYINAYQSYLWNMAVKEYLKKAGKDSFDKDLSVEVIGFGTEFKDSRIKEICLHIIGKEKITLRDFVVRRMPELSSEGDTRKVSVEPENLKIERIDKKTYNLSFFLPKGCYATTLIKHLLS